MRDQRRQEGWLGAFSAVTITLPKPKTVRLQPLSADIAIPLVWKVESRDKIDGGTSGAGGDDLPEP